MPGTRLWNVTVNIPGPPLGSASSLDDAKAQFRAAWLAFRKRHGPDRLAKAYREMTSGYNRGVVKRDAVTGRSFRTSGGVLGLLLLAFGSLLRSELIHHPSGGRMFPVFDHRIDGEDAS